MLIRQNWEDLFLKVTRREQAGLQEESSTKEKLLRDTQTRNNHELGEMKRAQELRVNVFSVTEIERKSRHNTGTHFTIAVDARTNEVYERFKGISRRGIKSQLEIVLRFQSACNDSKFSFHAEPQQTPAS